MFDISSVIMHWEESELLLVYQSSLCVLLVEEQPMCAHVAMPERGKSKSMLVDRHCDVCDELIFFACGPMKILNYGCLQGWYNLHCSWGTGDA